MTPEDRQKAISEAFYRISVYAMVTHTHSRDGLHRLEYMMEIIDEIPVVGNTDYNNFNHRYYKDILEDAIKQNKDFNKLFEKP
jgi:UDP-N-acetylglucosamine 2-epimerase